MGLYAAKFYLTCENPVDEAFCLQPTLAVENENMVLGEGTDSPSTPR
jgi:hypothetical protein